MRKTTIKVQDHTCCYHQCPEPGAIHTGVNGGDSHWICFHHLDRWNQTRARFIADGGGCEMQELGELLEQGTEQCCDGLCDADML